ncbi:hypothetical protein D0X99_07905 [Algoriphagus lacus]|uniref:Uncharacterized protein n=1 Tax=Algoriphagus lacus TaxID=2056311 RepID=A0A418PT75_9BACT|nr:hypothetical protein D0X99_07905 [Algoriphagus lacus]
MIYCLIFGRVLYPEGNIGVFKESKYRKTLFYVFNLKSQSMLPNLYYIQFKVPLSNALKRPGTFGSNHFGRTCKYILKVKD